MINHFAGYLHDIPERENAACAQPEDGEAEPEWEECEDVEEGIDTLEEAVRHELKHTEYMLLHLIIIVNCF